MYTIEELEDTFDWSYDQIRDRVLRLDDKIGDIFQRGSKNKILITEKGLSLLRKLNDLESSDKSIQNAIETIRQDLETSQSQENKKVSKKIKTDANQVVEILKERVQELQRDKKRLQEKNDTLEQRLLSGEVEENNKMKQLREKLHEKELEAEKMRVKLKQSENPEGKEEKPEASPWELFKNWLFKPR